MERLSTDWTVRLGQLRQYVAGQHAAMADESHYALAQWCIAALEEADEHLGESEVRIIHDKARELYSE